MSEITYIQALRAARTEHRTAIDARDRWSCTCGKGSPERMIPPTRPMSQAAAERHVNAVARRIMRQP